MSLKVSCCLSSFVLLAFFAISSSANAQQSECPPVSNNPLVMADLCSGPPMTGPLPAVLKMNVSRPPRNLQPIAAEVINHMRLVDAPTIGRGDALVYEANRNDFILELDVSNGKQIVAEPLTRADAENTTIAWKQGRTKLDYPETVNQRIIRIRIKPLHEIGTPLLVRGVKIVRYGRTILELSVSFPGRGEQPFEPPMSYPQDPRVMPTRVTMPSLLSKEAQPGFAASHIPGFSMSPMMVQATDTGTDVNHYKFNGKELDGETGLYNFGARYYSPGLGRYTSPDWSASPTAIPYANIFDPQTFNLYNFGRNNPLSMRDPDGHCPGDDCKNVKVDVKVIENPKIVQGEKQEDGSVRTGVRAKVQDTITVNGKSLDHATVKETNTYNVTLNGQPKNLPGNEGPSETNNAGQVNDTVGLLAPAGTAKQDVPLVDLLKTGAVNYTNKNTITFTTPDGQNCQCTATRTMMNVGSDGKGSPNYTIDPGHPVVTPVQPPAQPKEKEPK